MSFSGSLTAEASNVFWMGDIQSVEYEVDLEVHSNSTVDSPVPNTRWKVTFRLSRNGSGAQKIMHMKRPTDTGTGGNQQMMNSLADTNPVHLVPVLLDPGVSPSEDTTTRLRYQLAGVKRQFVSGQPETETYHSENVAELPISEVSQGLGQALPGTHFSQTQFPEFYSGGPSTYTYRDVLRFTPRNCQNASCDPGTGETGSQPLIVFTSPPDLSGLAGPTGVTAGTLKLRYTLFIRAYPVDASGNLITPSEPMSQMQLKLDLPLPH
jgi:hypothetical protein